MERFELSRRLPDLPHFECGPFSHLGTSPLVQITDIILSQKANLIKMNPKFFWFDM